VEQLITKRKLFPKIRIIDEFMNYMNQDDIDWDANMNCSANHPKSSDFDPNLPSVVA